MWSCGLVSRADPILLSSRPSLCSSLACSNVYIQTLISIMVRNGALRHRVPFSRCRDATALPLPSHCIVVAADLRLGARFAGGFFSVLHTLTLACGRDGASAVKPAIGNMLLAARRPGPFLGGVANPDVGASGIRCRSCWIRSLPSSLSVFSDRIAIRCAFGRGLPVLRLFLHAFRTAACASHAIAPWKHGVSALASTAVPLCAI